MSFIELTDVDLVYGASAQDKSAQTLAVSSATLSIVFTFRAALTSKGYSVECPEPHTRHAF